MRGLRRKAVLAALALQGGEIVSTGRLVDAAWGDTALPPALNTLQSHVSYLRTVLGSKAAIVARPPGYVLDLGDDATDVRLAERLLRQGRRAADPVHGAKELREALALWRGRSLEDVAGLAWLEEQAERLDLLGEQIRRAPSEARLAAGEHAQLVPELEQMVADHPLATGEIIERCARLPLALTIAAARAATRPDFPLAVTAAELRQATTALDPFDGGDLPTGIRAVFSPSYRALSTDVARLFRLLGLHPGLDITVAAASLAVIPPERARVLLAELARAHLLTEHSPGRYVLHDLLSAYATEQVHSRVARDAAMIRIRLLDHCPHTARACHRTAAFRRRARAVPYWGRGHIRPGFLDKPCAAGQRGSSRVVQPCLVIRLFRAWRSWLMRSCASGPRMPMVMVVSVAW